MGRIVTGGFKVVLTIRMFHGDFKAVAWRRSAVTGAYESPTPVQTLDEIGAALDATIDATGFDGKLVTFLYEGERMEHVFVTTPPMEQKDLKLFLARKAEQEKSFEGKAAFSHTQTTSPKGGYIVLLTICQKSFVDGLTDLCRERGLFVQKLIPPTTVMGHQMQEMGFDDGHLIAVVAEIGPRMTLLVGKGDGALLFDRYLNYDWRKPGDQDRIGREIERSILFAKQQFGQVAEAVVFIGDYDDAFAAKMTDMIDTPLDIGNHRTYEHYWLTEARMVRRIHPSNLIPASVRREAARHTITRIVIGMVFFFWLGAFAAAGGVEYAIHQSRSMMTDDHGATARLRQEKERWAATYAELERRKAAIDTIEQGAPPIPGWFVGYLGQATPEGLQLTKVTVAKNDGGWQVVLNGVSRLTQDKAAEALALFEKNLVDGPYRLAVARGWREEWLKELSRGSAARPDNRSAFVLEGRIR
jgi:hypothetical protein